MDKIPTYEILKQIRKSKNMSQKDLAEKVGLTQQAVALIENGKRKLELDLFLNMLTAMNATDSEINDSLKHSKAAPVLLALRTETVTTSTSYTDETEEQLLDYFSLLNENGRKKAVELLQILSKVPEFINLDTNNA